MRKDALSSKPLSGDAASQGIRVLMIVACMAVWSVQTARAQQQITDRWSRMADMDAPHEYHAAVAVDGKIYVV